MEYPLISIILPLYNVEPYILDCLNSICRQNYTGPMECIIVDDCGTDRSSEIVSDFITGYKGSICFSLLHHKSNRGQSAARNTGLDKASGDYIYFVDSDDYLDADAVQVLFDAIISDDYAIAIGHCVINKDGKDLKYRDEWLFKKPLIIEPSDYADTFLLEKSSHTIWNKLYKKEIFDQVRFREGKLNEDTLFILDSVPIVLSNNYRCIDLPIYKYHYRFRSGSTCLSPTQKFYFDCMQNLGEVIYAYGDNTEIIKLLRKRQLPYIISTARYKPRDKEMYYIACRKLKTFSDKMIADGNNLKGVIHILLFKYFPRLLCLMNL